MRSILPSICALLSGLVFFGLASGLLFTLIGVRLAMEGVSAQAIGILGSAYFAGFLAGTLVCDRIIHRVGHIRAFITFAVVSAIAVQIHVLITPIWVWTVLRVTMGFCMAGTLLVSESWLQFKATNETRGRTFALYAIAASGGFAAGPLLINLGDPVGNEVFLVASTLFSIALVPVALTRVGNPDLGRANRLGLRQLLAISPVAVAGTFAAGIILSSYAAMGPVFGQRIGLNPVQISLFMAAMGFGGILMQYPIGTLSDRFDRRGVMIALGLGSAAVAVSVFGIGAAVPLALVLLSFVHGGMCQPIYGLAVSHANDRFGPRDFVAASAGLLLANGIGTSIGPMAAAIVMDRADPSGLFLFFAVVSLGFSAFVAYRIWRRAPIPRDEQSHFVIVPPNPPGAASLDTSASPSVVGGSAASAVLPDRGAN